MKGIVCPLPQLRHKNIALAHGGGGRLMNNLITEVFLPAFNSQHLERKHDGAVLDINNTKLAFTTDSYVVNPLFFPGGDIGLLAIYGTVNDLAMCGAKPLYLSVGLILEEGFSTEELSKIINSMQKAAGIVGVQLVTGDTKVVDKGKGDGIFINTSGIGLIEGDVDISPASIKDEDVIILNGDIGRHGIAIMSVREGLEFESSIKSDLDFLSGVVNHLLKEKIAIHCFRDLTRGGLASALVEIAESANLKIELDENKILVVEEVQGACEILGLDPLYVANEGRFITICSKEESQKVLNVMKTHPQGINAQIIGKVKRDKSGIVTMKSKLGTERIVDMLSGEQLPRIC